MTGEQLVARAEEHVGESYVFGARVPKADAGWRGPWDCAEFASWLVFQATGRLFGCNGTDPTTADAYSGRWADDARRARATCGLAQAIGAAGAFLVRAPSGGAGIGHVALSRGDGSTVEAHSSRRGVCLARAEGRRWSFGVLVPGIELGPASRAAALPWRVLRIVRPMMTGADVAAVQRALVVAGYDAGPADGVYGYATERAVAAFQRARGLLVDGEVGDETTAELGIARTPICG